MTTKKMLLVGLIAATAFATSGAFAYDSKDIGDLGRVTALDLKAHGLSDAISFGFTGDTLMVTIPDADAFQDHLAMATILDIDDAQALGSGWLEFGLTIDEFEMVLHDRGLPLQRRLTSADMAMFVDGYTKALDLKAPDAKSMVRPGYMRVASIASGLWHDLMHKGKHALQGGTDAGLALGAV